MAQKEVLSFTMNAIALDGLSSTDDERLSLNGHVHVLNMKIGVFCMIDAYSLVYKFLMVLNLP